jgi:hypothetical protein
MMEILAWVEMCHSLQSITPSSLHAPSISREQLIWSSRARLPLANLAGKVLPLPVTKRKHDDASITAVEIRNSFSPSMPICVGELCRGGQCSGLMEQSHKIVGKIRVPVFLGHTEALEFFLKF